MSERAWRFYIDDMLTFAEHVVEFTDGFDQAGFELHRLHYDAVLRNLELISEAAMHVPDDVRNQHPAIPWRMIIATRNRLIHAYLGIDNDTVWSIVRGDIPVLLVELEKVRPRT